MIRQLVRTRRRYILIDVDTQRDFLLANGAACIRNHRRVLAHIRRIMAWARAKRIPIISICEIYPHNNTPLENTILQSSSLCSTSNFCLDCIKSQQKIRYTLINNRASFPADGNTDLPRDILRQYRQVILHKRCVDPFDEPRIDRLLSEVRANEFILVGTSLEGAVLATALGLLQRGKRVTVVADAVGCRNKSQANLALRKITAKGAKLIDTKKLAGHSHLRQVRICHCQSCQSNARKSPIAE